jgi:hypothetical protein
MNDWQDENEKRESMRRAQAQFEYDLYNQPAYVKKWSGYMASAILLMIGLLVIAGIGKAIWELVTGG